ncbi:MAG: DUF1648 domain-containing protein [Caldilineaceae bacterium]
MSVQTYSAPAEQSHSSMVFRPAPDSSRWTGLAVSVWILLVDLALAGWLTRRQADILSFVLLALILLSLPLLLHLFYRTWSAFTLEYWLDRDALRIRWAAQCVVIPLPAVELIVSEGEMALSPSPRTWPAPYIRQVVGQDGQSIDLLASRPPLASLWLQTADQFFAISPAQPTEFLAALQAYNRLGPSRTLAVERQQSGLCVYTVLQDSLSRWLLVAGFLGVLLLFAALFSTYPGLPERMIFHYDATGLPDSVRPKNALFLLPSIGLATWLVNSLAGLWMACRQQRSGAYLLWSSTLFVQLLSLLALFSLIR